jgi:DNA-binding NtrC family response regulator
MKSNILVVDDDKATLFGFSAYLSKQGYEVTCASLLREAEDLLLTKNFDTILLDLNLPDGSGMDWIAKIKMKNPETTIVIITGQGDISSAVEAMQKGADHYLTKPVNMEDLHIFMTQNIELQRLRRKDEAQRRTRKKTEPYFGNSPAMKKIFELASMAAGNDAVLLIHGQTGTGKGVLARWIHERGARAAEAFVEVNCASLRGELLSSELFGHVKGAFTSAVGDRQGLVEVANNGTLFLDEIGDMGQEIQSQFLKAIEEKTYRRLGETKERTSDFRLICATNRDLTRELNEGRFRNDLYYRISVFPITLPTLQQRYDDLPGLVQNVLAGMCAEIPALAEDVPAFLKKYHWPGNVRELKNAIERAVILSQGQKIERRHFPGLENSAIGQLSPSATPTLEDMENQHIQKILNECDGDTIKASQALGISRASLYRKLNKTKNTEDTE